jgi:hypothetical protein
MTKFDVFILALWEGMMEMMVYLFILWVVLGIIFLYLRSRMTDEDRRREQDVIRRLEEQRRRERLGRR